MDLLIQYLILFIVIILIVILIYKYRVKYAPMIFGNFDSDSEVIFVTGNANKARELSQLLGVKIDNRKIDLTEIQATPEEIVIDKCKRAYELIKKPCLIEDSSLEFDALGGMPGPYIKWFMESCELEDLYKIIKSFDNHSARAVSIFGYYDGEKEPKLFKGYCSGKIVEPRGTSGFGWDPIFEPDDNYKTFGEMTSDEKNRISHRTKAVHELSKFFKS